MPTHKTEKVLRISEFNLTKTNIITDVHIFVQNNHPHQPNGSCEQYINLAFDNQVHTIEFSRTRHPPYTTHHRPSEKLIFNLTGSSALPNNVSQELRGSPSYNKRRAETTRRPWRFSPADPLSAFLPTRVNYRTDPPPPANATTTRACRNIALWRQAASDLNVLNAKVSLHHPGAIALLEFPQAWTPASNDPVYRDGLAISVPSIRTGCWLRVLAHAREALLRHLRRSAYAHAPHRWPVRPRHLHRAKRRFATSALVLVEWSGVIACSARTGSPLPQRLQLRPHAPARFRWRRGPRR